MSAADKYGRVQDLPASAHRQVEEIGQALHSKGVTCDAHAAATPALKYGLPNVTGRERSLVLGRPR
jgi:hypothetical protein